MKISQLIPGRAYHFTADVRFFKWSKRVWWKPWTWRRRVIASEWQKLNDVLFPQQNTMAIRIDHDKHKVHFDDISIKRVPNKRHYFLAICQVCKHTWRVSDMEAFPPGDDLYCPVCDDDHIHFDEYSEEI